MPSLDTNYVTPRSEVFDKSNLLFYSLYYAEAYNELAGPSPRYCARASRLLSKKYRSGGEPLATLCPIWPARDLKLRPPAPETSALQLDQLAGRNYNAFKPHICVDF